MTAVIDDVYYELERELIDRYGSVHKSPAADPALVQIRKIWGWKKTKDRDISKFNYIEKFEMEYGAILKAEEVKQLAKQKNLLLKDFGETRGKSNNYLGGFLYGKKQTASKDVVKGIAEWLDIEEESIVRSYVKLKPQPQLDFDGEKVSDCMKEKEYVAEDLDAYLGAKEYTVRKAIQLGRGPAYIVKSLCDMAGIDPEED